MTTPTEAMRLALDALEQVKAPQSWPFAVKQDVSAAITALRDALATEGWRPIETAPKDGSMVLVNDTTKGWTPWVAASYLDGDEWSGWVYDDMTAQDSNPIGPNPTHWLSVPPLPGAPKD